MGNTAKMETDKTMMERFQANYDYLFTDLRDPRTDNMFLMSSPWPVLASCMVYYYIIRVAGPRFMKDRPPYDIQKVMIVYNFFQTFFSLWIFMMGAGFWLTGKYNWLCQPVDYSDTEDGWAALIMTWWYFFSKYVDYLDSLFFVLRKKWGHLSTLHVVHHGIMPFTAWWGVKYVGGGHTTFCGFLNMGVHVVMYFYYLMSACGPEVQKYLWWKKYLTTMQLAQFVTFFLHACLPLVLTDCGFPKVFSYIIIFHGGMFFLLFLNFYRQAYLKKGKKDSSNGAVTTNGTAKKAAASDIHANGAVKQD